MKILEVNKLTDFKHLNLFLTKYKDKIGNIKSWIFASRSYSPNVMMKITNTLEENAPIADNLIPSDMSLIYKPNAVVIVPFHVDYQKIVIIKEFRVPLGNYQYGFPAGLMDRGEELEETAARELKDETGLEIVSIIKKSPTIYSSSGMTDESISLVYATCKGEPSIKWNEESEDITVIMVSPKEAEILLANPEIKFDVKSWIVLSIFAQTGKI
ncbi:MAG: NUDIX hydrolase [Desulfamplus sp.]|nr:NUDIX hydrolase [Desulfamplus sp.]